jgi:glycosyltransferase involved in cell wall biosynthesis
LRADVYHSLHHFLPLGMRGRVVLTLHDLMQIEHPDITFPRRWQGYLVKAYAQVTIKYALRRADQVIAISQFTAGRAESLFGIPRAGMTIIPHGVEERFFRVGPGKDPGDDRWDTSAGPTPPRFFLVVGHSKPHKNVARVIGALALIAQRYGNVRLRLVGRGDGYDQLREQARSLGLSGKVDFLRVVPETMLLSLYRRAVALVMPSLVEGFGLPVLEAQAAGCPVIVSTRGALAETAGDAALLVEPTDTWDIARAMETLLRDEALRSDLVERGRARAAQFTWTRTAERTREVYDRAMAANVEHVPRALAAVGVT